MIYGVFNQTKTFISGMYVVHASDEFEKIGISVPSTSLL